MSIRTKPLFKMASVIYNLESIGEKFNKAQRHRFLETLNTETPANHIRKNHKMYATLAKRTLALLKEVNSEETA